MYWGYVFTEGNAAIAHGVGQHGVRFACRFVDGTGLLAFAVEEEGDAYALLSYGDVALAHLPAGVEDWPKRTRSTGRSTAFIRIPMARRVLLDVLAELLDQPSVVSGVILSSGGLPSLLIELQGGDLSEAIRRCLAVPGCERGRPLLVNEVEDLRDRRA